MAEITAAMVKELRERTGAGIMDCKNALAECEGDSEQAVELIKKKGLAKVAKKAGAIAAEGVVHAYIHPGSRIGVLAEINCQTDFVARSEDFKEFVDLLGMQIASMGAQYVRRGEVPAADVDKQKEIFAAQLAEEAAQTGKQKPPQVVEKIVDGKVDKWLAEVCLEEQPSITDSDRSIAALGDELSAKIGEKISVRRFVRYELGEGIEKKSADLAADVAAALETN
ncbi:MAG: translation elongation factor Ts [Myxococcales bacterium]|nr:translation elongation factor Ts [Myxococcales bacterium]